MSLNPIFHVLIVIGIAIILALLKASFIAWYKAGLSPFKDKAFWVTLKHLGYNKSTIVIIGFIFVSTGIILNIAILFNIMKDFLLSLKPAIYTFYALGMTFLFAGAIKKRH